MSRTLILTSARGKKIVVGLGDDFIVEAPMAGEYVENVYSVVRNCSGVVAVRETVEEIASKIDLQG